MNRRSLLTRPFKSLFSSPKPFNLTGIARYNGPWGNSEVKHLANRALFFYNQDQKAALESLSMDECLNLIFSVPAELEEPINFSFDEDPSVPIGESWLNKPFIKEVGQKQRNSRRASLDVWALRNLAKSPISLKEKIVLFWHNHFVTGDLRDPNFTHDYLEVFRSDPFGNLKDLTKKITINPGMLRYLNGRANTSKAPNENYARELLELFTIGKGDQVGPGDYTNYTEHDVAEIAKVLTGWKDVGRYPEADGVVPDSIFIPGRHDKSVKKLSARFDEIEIQNGMENEYKTVIDIIFQQDEVSRFFVRKLYRWFVYYEIDAAVEELVIEPLAKILRDNDYNVKPVLEVLFASEHFYDINSRGCIIKSPLDMFVGIMKQFKFNEPDSLLNEYYLYFRFSRSLRSNGMEYHNPPSVAGWEAYYQTPNFYRTWINSVSLVNRSKVMREFILRGLKVGDERIRIDFFWMVDKISDPKDPNVLVKEFSDFLLPMDLESIQYDYLLDELLGGLPEFEWGVEYQKYLDDPSDENLKMAIERKIQNLLLGIVNLPEYQLF